MMNGTAMLQTNLVSNTEDKNADIIQRLATEINRPIDEVKRVYDGEYARLKSDARIFDYLSLFATRQTRAALGLSH